ncbi:LysR family transcriptional regulator [Oxalobacteraceae bacterium OM1]|nr:LysR family transcriptional regulator [Oxalobacteraceae bacterium OM1]
MKNDTTSELAFFVLLARKGSLSATARELDLTPPAVTKRLAQLEQRLGTRLVNRTTRSLSLTAEGQVYVDHAVRILDEIRAMEDDVASRRATPRGLLRVNAPLGFGRLVIAPLMSEFARRFPEVEAQLQLTDRPVDLVEEAFDLAIRFGEPADTRLSARKLMSNRRFLCAAPAYLRRHGEPSTPADLARHRCIVHLQNDAPHYTWRLARGRAVETVRVPGALASNDGDVVLNWALDGHGILVRSEWDAAKYLQSGRLQLVLPAWHLPSADLYAYFPTRKNMPAKVRGFLDVLVERLARPAG